MGLLVPIRVSFHAVPSVERVFYDGLSAKAHVLSAFVPHVPAVHEVGGFREVVPVFGQRQVAQLQIFVASLRVT